MNSLGPQPVLALGEEQAARLDAHAGAFPPAVGALEGVKTPANVAKMVMERTDHHLLVGKDAQTFARNMGFEILPDLNTPRSRNAWLEWKRATDPARWIKNPEGREQAGREVMLDLVKRHKGNFRVAYALTGVVLDQLQAWAPDVIDLFKKLAATGCCEFVGETYDHSLSFLYSRDEFAAQVDMHTRKIRDLFGQTPTVFRNTELIYNNELAQFLSSMKDDHGKPRWAATLCEIRFSGKGRR